MVSFYDVVYVVIRGRSTHLQQSFIFENELGFRTLLYMFMF